MIKIRYRDPNELSPGLHAAAECHGRSTTVYLLSGLTAAERRAALRRLRLSARMGYCPRLPAAQLAFALFADRIRTGVGQTGAVFRSHPAGSTVPVMVVSAGAVAFLLLSTVSIRVLHPPRSADQLPPSFPAPSVAAVPMPGWSQSPAAGRWGLPGSGLPGSGVRQVTWTRTGSGGSAAFSVPAISGFGTGAGSGAAAGGTGTTSGGASSTGTSTSHNSGTGSGTSGGSGAGGSTSGGADPGSTPVPAPGVTSAAAAASAPAATPASSAAAQPTATVSPAGGSCLDVGSLGVCLDL